MTRISWPVALIVAALIAAVTVGLVFDKPVSELMTLGNLIIMGLLYGELQTVKTQTNGQSHRLMSIVERQTTGSGSTEDVKPPKE